MGTERLEQRRAELGRDLARRFPGDERVGSEPAHPVEGVRAVCGLFDGRADHDRAVAHEDHADGITDRVGEPAPGVRVEDLTLVLVDQAQPAVEHARRLVRDLGEAAEGYQRVIDLHRADDPGFPRELRARALWGAAVTRLLSLEPSGDTAPTKTLLQTLSTSYDGTLEAQQARWAMAALKEIDRLRAQGSRKDEDIRRLNEQMEQLKRIDLNRRPTTPPEP